MRQALIGFVLLCLFAFLPSCATAKINTLEELQLKENTPDKLGWWLESNIWYHLEQTDCWQAPERTFKTKKGDCEDFVILGKYILDKQGYKTWFVIIIPYEKRAHAVCVYESKGKFYVMDNGEIHLTNAKDFAGVSKYLTEKNGENCGLNLLDDVDIAERIRLTKGY